MNFPTFDNLLDKYPKDLNKVIYNYYTTNCGECGNDQIYCFRCELYNCSCVKNIKFCNVSECTKILCCFNSNQIYINGPYLCDRCWNIDISDDILEDIRIEQTSPEESWWCLHGDNFHIEINQTRNQYHD